MTIPVVSRSAETDAPVLDILAERTPAPVDWQALRTQSHLPPATASLIDRVLASGARAANSTASGQD